MSYGLKYQCLFDPIATLSADPVYSLQILQKDYSGDVTNMVGAGIPVTHSWGTDEPKAPIKGSSLSIKLINNGTLPIESFLSIDDDEYQVLFFYGTQLMFAGFLVQDDFSEPLLDYTHEINLSANDNLGLLKEVALDKAKVTYKRIGAINDMWSKTAPHTVTLPAVPLSNAVQVGDILQIHSLIFDVDYTVTDISGNPNFIVEETVTTGSTGTSDDIILMRPILFADKITLLEVIKNCLAATGLQINTKVFCNYEETSMDSTVSFLEQTLIDPQTFLKDANSYDNCYSILEKIMTRFNCTLFQAKGAWNIVHWDELRYSGYPIPGYKYDADFTLIGNITLNDQSIIFGGFNKFQIGNEEDTVGQSSLLKRFSRSLKFVKETFNFKPPAQLLRNFDLTQLGTEINSFTTGSGINLQTTREYKVPWWVDDVLLGGVPTPAVYFIRVISDFLDNEIERYLVLNNPSAWPIDSYKIEATAGDSFKFSFSERTETSNPGGSYLLFIYLTDGISTRYFHDDKWDTLQNAMVFPVDLLDDTNVWHSLEESTLAQPVPFDGLLYFIFYPAHDSVGSLTSGETQIRDIRLEYNYFINQSTKIIGQTHTANQLPVIKQQDEFEIFIDDSPRNSLAGTLFLSSTTGLINDRTKSWYLTSPAALGRLGALTTFELLFWRRITRYILEGTCYGLISPDTLGDHISMLSVFNYIPFPGLNLIAGRMVIDYKNNNFSGTLWEMCDDSEEDADLTSTYEFKYLYAPK